MTSRPSERVTCPGVSRDSIHHHHGLHGHDAARAAIDARAETWGHGKPWENSARLVRSLPIEAGGASAFCVPTVHRSFRSPHTAAVRLRRIHIATRSAVSRTIAHTLFYSHEAMGEALGGVYGSLSGDRERHRFRRKSRRTGIGSKDRVCLRRRDRSAGRPAALDIFRMAFTVTGLA